MLDFQLLELRIPSQIQMVDSTFTSASRPKLCVCVFFLGNVLPTQLVPIAPFVLNIPGRNSSATVELTFLAENLPPLGYKAYHVTKKAGDEVVEGISIEEGIALKTKAWVGFSSNCYVIEINGKLLGDSCDY